jgi:hypothetical protein
LTLNLQVSCGSLPFPLSSERASILIVPTERQLGAATAIVAPTVNPRAQRALTMAIRTALDMDKKGKPFTTEQLLSGIRPTVPHPRPLQRRARRCRTGPTAVGFIAAVTSELSMKSGLRLPTGVELWIYGHPPRCSHRFFVVPPDRAARPRLRPARSRRPRRGLVPTPGAAVRGRLHRGMTN